MNFSSLTVKFEEVFGPPGFDDCQAAVSFDDCQATVHTPACHRSAVEVKSTVVKDLRLLVNNVEEQAKNQTLSECDVQLLAGTQW